jgi:hypothetical protein
MLRMRYKPHLHVCCSLPLDQEQQKENNRNWLPACFSVKRKARRNGSGSFSIRKRPWSLALDACEVASTSRAGQRRTYAYDELNRLTTET